MKLWITETKDHPDPYTKAYLYNLEKKMEKKCVPLDKNKISVYRDGMNRGDEE